MNIYLSKLNYVSQNILQKHPFKIVLSRVCIGKSSACVRKYFNVSVNLGKFLLAHYNKQGFYVVVPFVGSMALGQNYQFHSHDEREFANSTVTTIQWCWRNPVKVAPVLFISGSMHRKTKSTARIV